MRLNLYRVFLLACIELFLFGVYERCKKNNNKNCFTFYKILYKIELEDEMEEKIINLIAEKLGKKKETINTKSRLVEDLGADSLDVVELIMTFEDEFGVSLPDEDVSKLKTVGDIVEYIKKIK